MEKQENNNNSVAQPKIIESKLDKMRNSLKKQKGRGYREHLDGRRSYEDDEVPFESIQSSSHEGSHQKSVEGWIVFITGVHEECQEDYLIDKFSEFGQIRNCHLNLDRRTGFVKGYALVEYEKYNEANEAIKAMNGKMLYDQPVVCDFAFQCAPIC